MRTGFDKPDLLNRIKSVKLEMGGTGWGDQTVGFEFLTWLSRSDSLETLKLSECLCEDVEKVAYLFNSKCSRFKNLNKLTIIETADFSARFSPALVYGLCRLPSLTRFKINASLFRGNNDEDNNWRGVTERYRFHPTSRKELASLIFASGDFDLHHLESALSLLIIRSLTIPNIGGTGHFRDLNPAERNTNDYGLNDPYSPARLQPILHKAANYLEQLELGHNYHDLWYKTSNHDGTTINLSDFHLLRKITLASSVLFGPDRTSTNLATKTPVYRLLPPSLEQFTVTFDGPQGIYWSIEQLESFWREGRIDRKTDEIWTEGFGNAGKTVEALSWMIEIVERKENKFPRLRSVEARECHEIQCIRGEWRRFDLLAVYPELFAGAVDVETRVEVYVPRVEEWDVIVPGDVRVT